MSNQKTGPEGEPGPRTEQEFPGEEQLEATRRIAYCLSIDMVGSTEKGLSLTTPQFARFNKGLVRQIVPHIDGVGLTHALLKFAGDGWLLVTHDPEDIRPLCCLAKIMAARFREEMAELSGLPLEKIPPLRLAIGSGEDLHVRLPNGQLDYVGDSARRATRSTQWCQTGCEPAEVLVCDVVRGVVDRDFEGTSADITQTRNPPRKWEEDFALYVLGTLRAELLGDADAPDCYAYAFGALGRSKEAVAALARAAQAKLPPPGLPSDTVVHRWNRLLAGVASYAEAERVVADMRHSGSIPDVFTYSILMNMAATYDKTVEWFKEMKEAGVAPNVVSYNTLISKARTYGEAEQWFKEMKEAGVAPDVFSYSTLISKARTYGEAEQWFKAMKEAGVAPDVVSYNTLISKAPSYGEAEQWFKEMQEAGVAPDVFSYSTLISKAPSYGEAEQWFKEMQEAGVAPDVVSYSTLISKARTYGEAEQWFKAMQEAGVAPDVFSYSTLISKAPSYGEAEQWFKEMQEAGVAPNVVSYSTLISKAPSYGEAERWFKEMKEAGVAPNVVSYNTLMNRAPDGEEAKALLEEMIRAGLVPTGKTYKVLMTKGISAEQAREHLDRVRKRLEEEG